MKRRKTAGTKILGTPTYLSGKMFTVADMQSETGETSGTLRAALTVLKSQGVVLPGSVAGTYRKPVPHFIFQRRLANPVIEEGENAK